MKCNLGGKGRILNDTVFLRGRSDETQKAPLLRISSNYTEILSICRIQSTTLSLDKRVRYGCDLRGCSFVCSNRHFGGICQLDL
jgi:hypothetical protein